MKYILNPYYTLRHDLKRTFILGGRNGQTGDASAIDPNWKSIIHPAYAMMLAFFSRPVELEKAINDITGFFSMSEKQISDFLSHIINANECWHTCLCGFESGFPKGLIIPVEEQLETFNNYLPEDFRFTELDFTSRRMISSPLSIVWMPNNNCHTSCEYCYADRSQHKHIFSLEEINAFVKDAKRSGVLEIMLTGGDFFENPHWREILDVLRKEGFNIDMVSTKRPLSKQEIIDFKKYGIRLQISFDTIDNEGAQKLLHVNSLYIDRIKQALKHVDENAISYQVATVLTNVNDSLLNLEGLHAFLSSLDNLQHWEIRVAFRSLYSKADFNEIKSSRQQIDRIAKWIDWTKKISKIHILWSPDDDDKYKKSRGGSQYFEGPVCSANMSNMVVLPDGNVTICEQLYWNPEFIIGNVFEQSICDIWNSDKAVSLWKKSQETISVKSPCHHCKDFSECFENGNRCYANILKAYGMNNSDYPDPRCFHAPDFKNDITHE